MNFFNAAEGVENYANAGKNKSEMPFGKMIALGVLAGILIGIPAMVTNMASYSFDNNSLVRIISGVFFAFGLGIVVLTGAELFTGNTPIIISVLDKRTSVVKMLRNWITVYISNFVGAILVSLAAAKFNWMSAGNGALAEFCFKLANSKMTMSFQNAFVMGILCNMLVTLAVLVSLQAKDVTGRILGAWVPVMFFVIAGFSHSIADMTYCMMALFAKSVYPEIAANYPSLTWGNYFSGNMLPVTLGNIVGGCAVGVLFWFAYLRKKK